MQGHRAKTAGPKVLAVVVGLLALAPLGLSAVTNASPASGVTPTLIARGSYDDFKVKTDPKSPIDIQAKAKSAVDIVMRRHAYEAGSTTGWHKHPGPVFITVTKGTLTYYLYDDPDCTPHVVTAGNGFVDDGRGHVVRNESGAPAEDHSIILAPVGGAFRGELSAPAPNCSF